MRVKIKGLSLRHQKVYPKIKDGDEFNADIHELKGGSKLIICHCDRGGQFRFGDKELEEVTK